MGDNDAQYQLEQNAKEQAMFEFFDDPFNWFNYIQIVKRQPVISREEWNKWTGQVK